MAPCGFYPQCRASIGKQSSAIVVSTESHFGSNLASAEGNLLQQWAKLDQNTFAGIATTAGSPTATDAGNASAPGSHGWSRGHTQFASPPAWARYDAGC